MRIIIINTETNIVENIAVNAEGTDTFSLVEGYYSVLSEEGSIGDTYDPVEETFTSP